MRNLNANCGNCAYGVVSPEDMTKRLCIRFPPTHQFIQAGRQVGAMVGWPQIQVNGICGEHPNYHQKTILGNGP